jgi:hypothetical protein
VRSVQPFGAEADWGGGAACAAGAAALAPLPAAGAAGLGPLLTAGAEAFAPLPAAGAAPLGPLPAAGAAAPVEPGGRAGGGAVPWGRMTPTRGPMIITIRRPSIIDRCSTIAMSVTAFTTLSSIACPVSG